MQIKFLAEDSTSSGNDTEKFLLTRLEDRGSPLFNLFMKAKPGTVWLDRLGELNFTKYLPSPENEINVSTLIVNVALYPFFLPFVLFSFLSLAERLFSCTFPRKTKSQRAL